MRMLSTRSGDGAPRAPSGRLVRWTYDWERDEWRQM
jgi:hypothetical protein